jgi:hypothetical protein
MYSQGLDSLMLPEMKVITMGTHRGMLRKLPLNAGERHSAPMPSHLAADSYSCQLAAGLGDTDTWQ